VFVLFDGPVALSMIRLWNYRKTPARGAREISVYLDGRLLYKVRLVLGTI
jgi:protein JBTS26